MPPFRTGRRTTALTTTMTTARLPDTFTYTTTELVSGLVEPSACAYGSEGWEFESLRARSLPAQMCSPAIRRGRVVTDCHNSCQTLRAVGQGVGLRVHIGSHCERHVGVAEPGRNHCGRDPLQMHRGAAGMPSVVQPDPRHTGRDDSVGPHLGQRVEVIRLRLRCTPRNRGRRSRRQVSAFGRPDVFSPLKSRCRHRTENTSAVAASVR